MKVHPYFYIPLYVIIVTAVLYGLHWTIVESLAGTFKFFYAVWKIYIFHFVVTLIILSTLYMVSKRLPNYVGYVFMGFILFKMTAAVIFLIPLIKMVGVSKIPDFVSFFVPYFIYLLLEILVTLKLLKQSEV